MPLIDTLACQGVPTPTTMDDIGMQAALQASRGDQDLEEAILQAVLQASLADGGGDGAVAPPAAAAAPAVAAFDFAPPPPPGGINPFAASPPTCSSGAATSPFTFGSASLPQAPASASPFTFGTPQSAATSSMSMASSAPSPAPSVAGFTFSPPGAQPSGFNFSTSPPPPAGPFTFTAPPPPAARTPPNPFAFAAPPPPSGASFGGGAAFAPFGTPSAAEDDDDDDDDDGSASPASPLPTAPFREASRPPESMEGVWSSALLCVPSSFHHSLCHGRGDKVLLPGEALEGMMDAMYARHGTRHLPNPLCFRLANGDVSKLCGVLEFTAPEGHVVVPQWILDSIGCGELTPVTVSSADVPRATAVQLRPMASSFMHISDQQG